MKNCKYHIVRTVHQSNREMKKTQNTTLSEQFLNPIEILKQKNTKYHTVRTAPQSYREIDLKNPHKIPHCRVSSKIQ